MTAGRPGSHSRAEPVEQTADDDTAEHPVALQRLYDSALERAAGDGSPALQRYLSVLLRAS